MTKKRLRLQTKLKLLFPKSNLYRRTRFATNWMAYADDYGINTEFLENAFLAQLREETGSDLRPKSENLNYSCGALKKLFGYFKRNRKTADALGRCNGHKANQPAIANRAYANRIGNGNIASGDGWRFRGKGYIQLTGRSNYTRTLATMRKVSNIFVTPNQFADTINKTPFAVLSALAFFKNNNLGRARNVDAMTRKINKHTESYHARRKHYLKIAYV